MDAVPGGEWQAGPRPPWPEPLRMENAEPGRVLAVQFREGEDEGREPAAMERVQQEAGKAEPESGDNLDGEDDLSSEEPEGAENMVYDWNPELGRMQNYRLLNDSDDAYSGEEYFLATPGGSYRRRYRRTNSEREEDEEQMEVDETGPTEAEGEGEVDRSRPPVNADWWDFETLFRYRKDAAQERRARKLKEAGLFTPQLLKEFLRTRLAAEHSALFPHMAFDHILSWNHEERTQFAQFAVIVISGQWEENWDERVARYFETGEV